MQIGDRMPDVLGTDQNGNEIKAADLKGQNVVLYFYPKDMTSGCTAQACNIRDNYKELRDAGFRVIGVSVDDAAKHRKFIEKNGLPFDLIADTDKNLVSAFGVWAEKKMCARFDTSTNAFRRAASRVAVRQASAHPVSEFLGTCLIVFVLWYGGTLIFSQHSPIDAPTFIFYMVILYSTIQPLKDFAKASYSIPKGMASVERVNKILNSKNPIVEKKAPLSISGLKDEIVFDNVHFSYHGHGEVLHGVSLTVKRGQTIAIVGQSGSGKSTLVDLIPRYHDVTGGRITIDGIDVRDLRIADLRGIIGNVNQEAILFNDSFFNNIAFGVENATEEDVINAAKVANAHDFIMESEHGYDTSVGDRGCRLSGGQRQRISIARAILKNPDILILDEATSALDTESERLVQEALERLMKTRTTIAIAHRLSTIKNADEIYVLHEGRIVERGTHDELLERNGYYRKLNDMQQL